MPENSLLNLINLAKGISAQSLEDASNSDAENLFPEKTLKKLTKENFLISATSRKFGGHDLGLVSNANLHLLQILKYIGGGNLVMGRVLEGHINAQILINQFGTEDQKERFAKDAIDEKLFAVWNTQANDGTTLTKKENGDYFLNGSKTFATGTDYVSRPIITAALDDGSWQMLVVPLDEIDKKIDPSWWHPMGMKSSRSYKIIFEDALISKDNFLGNPGSYYAQPGFSGGAVRFAAVQLGAAEMLLKETIKYLKSLNRTEDPFQQMRIGQMTIAISSGNLWLEGAAKKMDAYMDNSSAENSDIFLVYTNMMRTAIEQICTEVMALCQKCVGARGLNKPYHFERIIRDLNTYLRQPAPDASLADVGRFALESDIELDDLWDQKKTMMKVSETDRFPLAPENCVLGFGLTIIVAPHADDESLGCGGVISLLRKFGVPVYILLLTDGTLSHPNSKKFPLEKLRDLREHEMIEAAEILNVNAENLIFCRYKDRQLPDQNSDDFESAVKNISKIFEILNPQSIFVPWRRDPHPDHRAAYQLIKRANDDGIKLYEYPIWLKELGESGDAPTSEEVMPFRLDISSVLTQKLEAISAHKSQITDLIDDDPEGFRISEEMINDFNVPYETFFISK